MVDNNLRKQPAENASASRHGENDNLPADGDALKQLRIDADGRVREFILSPNDEEEVMALITELSDRADADRHAYREDLVDWRVGVAILAVAGTLAWLAFLYI